MVVLQESLSIIGIVTIVDGRVFVCVYVLIFVKHMPLCLAHNMCYKRAF